MKIDKIYSKTLIRAKELTSSMAELMKLIKKSESQNEIEYLKFMFSKNLYLANLYIEIFDSYDFVREKVKAPNVVNLMTFSQYIKEVDYIYIGE